MSLHSETKEQDLVRKAIARADLSNGTKVECLKGLLRVIKGPWAETVKYIDSDHLSVNGHRMNIRQLAV